MPPRPYFGNISETHLREGGRKQDSCSGKAGFGRPLVLDDPEPYLPEDFFERLAAAQLPYEGIIPSRRDTSLQENKRRRSNVLGLSNSHYRRPGDHWLNWRERLAQELEGVSENTSVESSDAIRETVLPI